jgi:predicted transposase YbfD/YdcC
VDADHGRIEIRTTTVIHDVDWLCKRHKWPGLNAVIVINSEREAGGRTERDTRFYITSLALAASLLAPVVRSHWMVEKGLHWVLDTVFRDDECRLRTDHAPANFCTI